MLHVFCFSMFIWSVHSQIWMTQFDQHFQFVCPPGQTIRSLVSFHENHYEDRVWNFSCAAPPHGVALATCQWSGFENDFDQLLEFQCPNESIISGIESVNDNGHEDRKWSFLCCDPEGYVTHACLYTPYVNTYDNVLNYRVPNDFVLRGVDSVHDNHYEDRIFKFDICKLDPIGEIEEGAVVG
ncbi:hemagglutinin/amebocyte aggregation factor-like [Biomphalaria glabrata]|uniref:Hemagglutinin/amebocyte aggregation factor-like n=1 Tax=Biomphalaria glabrata TaxID=6526 RepID=A0A2C9K9R8_BIOGL|nr:hemagglutinin/amebocyte aggregation factor-like [Biomphalaria glabrata]KAI8790942.1 hemagglutinin/amebocyte aggregation factor [Biomphalaria glabrata]